MHTIIDVQPTDARELATARLLPFSRELVFAAFERPEALAAWWGPNGFTNHFSTFEFMPGGAWRFDMVGPDGKTYAQESRFIETTAPSRVVVEHQNAPRFVLAVTLEADGDRATRLTWRQRFETEALARELAAVCVPANEQNLDRLCAWLERNTPSL